MQEIESFTRSHFPMLTKVSIWYNKFSCEFLTSFLPPLQNWTKRLKFVSNPWVTKPDTICVSKSANTTETTISYGNTEMNENISTNLLFVGISLPIIGVIIIASICFVFQRRLSKKKATNIYDEPMNLSNADGAGIIVKCDSELIDVEKIPSNYCKNSVSNEPIYEEIPDLGDTYDHLGFDTDPIPISTNNHYDNHLLLEK